MPSLTVTARRWRFEPRLIAGIALLFLVLAGLALRPDEASTANVAPTSLARRIEGANVALAVPISWLATPLVGLAADDRLDVIGVRTGDPTSIYPLAVDARLLSQDERAMTVSVRPDDAAQLALARANGLLLVPLLRSTR